ncbi:MAG: glucose-1-phosphate adenylyltransferase subunit GlgD [Clostridia bacterium]|nr:glucose-1-phosphate adenylyltransferase subunit GlgD [Clostridia bacterium]
MKSLGIIFSNIHDKEVNELTASRTLASVPYAGRYRLIDFVLSNMVNSGIGNVGIITKYNYQSLMEHIGSGKSWDLSRKNGGLVILPPYGREMSTVYNSRFEAISNSAYYLREAEEDYVVMSDCDNVCNIDFSEVVNYHIQKHADITVIYRKKEIVEGETKTRTAVEVDENGRVQKVVTGNKNHGVINAYTNMLVINRKFLLSIIDEADDLGYKSFSRDVLIRGVKEYNIYGYEYDGYFASIDSMPNYYKHSLQLLDKDIRDQLFRGAGAIYTKVRDSAPAKITDSGKVKNSMIADGCIIEGEVENSILFRGVKVAKGAKVSNSILFYNSTVGTNSTVNCVIADKHTHILENRTLSGHETRPYFLPRNTIV